MDRNKVNTRDRTIPQGYDSIKLHYSDDPLDNNLENDPDYYYHEYVVGNESQAIALFLVSFTFDPEADARKRYGTLYVVNSLRIMWV